jgi:uncharacterized protein
MSKKSALVIFFILSYLFTWANWGPRALSAQGFPTVELPEFLIILSGYGPALAALIVTAAFSGRQGLRELGARLVKWRVGLQWYAVALLLPIAITLLALGIHRLTGGAMPDFARAEFPFGPSDTPLLQKILLLFLIFTLGFDGLGEELGWRGFALPKLQQVASPLVASLVLGLLWAGWHIPYALSDGSHLSAIPLPVFFVNLMALATLYTWLFNNTQGSILLAILFHASGNTISNLLPILPPAAADLSIYYITVGLHWTLALVILFVTGPTLSPKRSLAPIS